LCPPVFCTAPSHLFLRFPTSQCGEHRFSLLFSSDFALPCPPFSAPRRGGGSTSRWPFGSFFCYPSDSQCGEYLGVLFGLFSRVPFHRPVPLSVFSSPLCSAGRCALFLPPSDVFFPFVFWNHISYLSALGRTAFGLRNFCLVMASLDSRFFFVFSPPLVTAWTPLQRSGPSYTLTRAETSAPNQLPLPAGRCYTMMSRDRAVVSECGQWAQHNNYNRDGRNFQLALWAAPPPPPCRRVGGPPFVGRPFSK